MKYSHIKTGNVLDTPFEITSKAWMPVAKPKKPAKDDKPPKDAEPPKEGKD